MKQKLTRSESGRLGAIQKSLNTKQRYDESPKVCPVCGKTIPYEKRHYDTCSRECSYELRIKNRNQHTSENVGGLYCPYCGKECKNPNSLAQHSIRCSKNPDRKIQNNLKDWNDKVKNNEVYVWNKGLDKTDERVLQYSIKNSIVQKGKVGTPHTEEYKQKMSEIAKRRELGGYHTSRSFDYKGIHLDSTYELLVAQDLDKNNIKWIRPSHVLWTDDTGIQHRYYGDFYLPEYDVYLDPKNRNLIENPTERFGITDVEKIHKVEEQNGITILILDVDHLDWISIKHLIEHKEDRI